MINVVVFIVDELGMIYMGFLSVENECINLYDVGYGKGVGSFFVFEVWEGVWY